MPYTNFTDRGVPYHLDGSVVKIIHPSVGVIKSYTAAEMLELNDEDLTGIVAGVGGDIVAVFFPELRDISGIFAICSGKSGLTPDMLLAISGLKGSADSTNGMDGTWVDATLPNGYPSNSNNFDGWREGIKAITGLGGIKALKFTLPGDVDWAASTRILHLYGKKTTGQTPRDLIFLDPQNSDAEYAIPMDFADRPAGTSVIRQIKVKNVDASLTANNITVESIDPVDDIRLSDSEAGPWVTSKTIASLAPNTASAVIYVKCETDAPPTPLGPMRAPIKLSVGAWA